jgi:sigma-B regulation protein RsbU (phosphoserine phosphatase)
MDEYQTFQRSPERRQNLPQFVAAPVMAERRETPDRRTQHYLSHLGLFDGVPAELVEPMLARCPVRELAPGEILLRAGDPNDGIHLLLTGELRVYLGALDTQQFIAISVGACIGELSIIDGKPISAHVVGGERCRILKIQEETFWNEIITVPGVARNLLRTLSERMRANNDIILSRIRDRLQLDALHHELRIASRIQSSMLPSRFPLFGDRAEIDLHASMEPATDVGGDFYDAFLTGPERLFVMIGDVSGKGVPAALFMAKCMTHLRMEALKGGAPHEILRAVNDTLCESNESEMFVTVFCGVLDLASGVFGFSVGGHNPPLLRRGEAGRFEYFDLEPKGILLGLVERRAYAPRALTLAPGDWLVLYTDGVTEALDETLALYGEARLQSLLSRERHASARALIDTVTADVAAFAGAAPRADDITLLALRYLGRPLAPTGG